MRSCSYLKCEECEVLVWTSCGPMTCPKCGKDVVRKDNPLPFAIFLVPEDKESFLLNRVEGRWKVKHYIHLKEMSAQEMLQLAQVKKVL